MNSYSYEDIMKMQEEAKQRVLEMQKKSKMAINDFNEKRNESKEKNRDLPTVAKAISLPVELQKNRKNNNAFSQVASFNIPQAFNSIFGDLSNDEYEKMFILALGLLLTKEGLDESLLIALMYIIT